MSAERELPVSIEAEQAVLGGLLLAPATLPKVADWLAEGDFYQADHRLIFRAILALASADKPFDPVTLGEWLEANDAPGLGGYLIDLASQTPSAANAVAYAEIVVERARLRQAIGLGATLIERAYAKGATSDAVTGYAQTALAGFAPVKTTGLLPSRDGLKSWWQSVLERTDQPGMIGLPTPWAELNTATKGLRGGRLYVLAGRPGMGKSIIGGQQAAFTALRGDRAALFSLEMSAEEVHQRNVAALANVPHDFLESPTSDSPHWGAVSAAVGELNAAALLVDDSPGLTASQLCARAERAHLQSPLKLIVVDHLHEMAVDPKDRVNALGDAARRLKGLAKRLNVPVLLLAQLNRGATGRENKRPTMADLRASGAIEEVADAIFLLHREDYYDANTHLRDVVELHIAKGRNLRSGVTINLLNNYGCMRADDWRGALPQAPAATEPRTRGMTYNNRSNA